MFFTGKVNDLGRRTLKVGVRHKFISLILCKKSCIGYDRSKINFYKKVYLLASTVMYFSCFAKKSTKRRRPRGVEAVRSRAQSQRIMVWLPLAIILIRESLRGAPPLGTPRRALTKVPEHLNLDPVQAKNVPIFCLKGKISKEHTLPGTSFREHRW